MFTELVTPFLYLNRYQDLYIEKMIIKLLRYISVRLM